MNDENNKGDKCSFFRRSSGLIKNNGATKKLISIKPWAELPEDVEIGEDWVYVLCGGDLAPYLCHVTDSQEERYVVPKVVQQLMYSAPIDGDWWMGSSAGYHDLKRQRDDEEKG